MGKYFALYKALYIAATENIGSSYVEIGVYKGSSFKHAIRCTKKLIKYNSNFNKIKFYGYDSFEGFESQNIKLTNNTFFKNHNFKSDFSKVTKDI
jgi:hypothetical protein